MANKKIRLQYSGFVIFLAKMLSVVTGLGFTLMITRTTTSQELGIWSNVGDIIAYFTFLAFAFPFWAMRFVARGKEGAAKTGIVANLIISILTTIIYLSLVMLVVSWLGISEAYVILYLGASIQIIESYLMNALEWCLRAKTPQTIGYGLFIGEVIKIIVAYILIVQLHQSLLGALISLIVAAAIQITYYLTLLSKELKQPVKWSYIKEWIKGSTINIYDQIGVRISAFMFILLFVYGGEAARGTYQVGATIASVILYSSFLSYALYPKLLAENSLEDITTSLKSVLMFAMPMTIGSIALADSYLIIQNVIYKEAVPVLVVLAINNFIHTISVFLYSVLLGLERVDEKAKIPLRKLVRSRLFMNFTLPYAHSAITLPTTFLILTTFARDQPLTAAVTVAVIDTIARLVMLLIQYVIVRGMIKLDMSWRNIAKYFFASAIMGFILFLIPHPTRLTLTVGMTAAGGILYFTLLMAIDKEARTLVKSIWREIRSKGET